MSRRLRSPVPAVAAVAVALACAGPAAAAGDRPGSRGAPAPEQAPEQTTGERAAQIALTAVGIPYRWGGESPASGFDCSGLVRWTYGRLGFDLPHSSYALYGEGRRVSESRMVPGDILFFEGLGHVGLYLGRGRMVHAPQSGRDVEVVRLGDTGYGARLIGARRIASA